MRNIFYEKRTRAIFLVSVSGLIGIGLLDVFSKSKISINNSTVLGVIHVLLWIVFVYSIFRAVGSDYQAMSERIRLNQQQPGNITPKRWAWTLVLIIILVLYFIITTFLSMS